MILFYLSAQGRPRKTTILGGLGGSRLVPVIPHHAHAAHLNFTPVAYAALQTGQQKPSEPIKLTRCVGAYQRRALGYAVPCRTFIPNSASLYMTGRKVGAAADLTQLTERLPFQLDKPFRGDFRRRAGICAVWAARPSDRGEAGRKALAEHLGNQRNGHNRAGSKAFKSRSMVLMPFMQIFTPKSIGPRKNRSALCMEHGRRKEFGAGVDHLKAFGGCAATAVAEHDGFGQVGGARCETMTDVMSPDSLKSGGRFPVLQGPALTKAGELFSPSPPITISG